MARKRLLYEVDTFEKVQEPVSNASLHATLTSLSPLKKGKHSVYFDGTLTDGTTERRFVGFSSEQQKKLASFHSSHTPAHLSNCELKKARQGDEMEVLLKKFTKISESPKKINIPDSTVDTAPPVIQLRQLSTLQAFQKVNVDVRVVHIHEPKIVTGGKKKQEVVVSDSTATAHLTLWEDNVDTMEEESCYSLKAIVVRQYEDFPKYLSMARNGSTIDPISDIGTFVPYDSDNEDDQRRELDCATIIAVIHFGTYKGCLVCKARVESTNPPLGRCTKCSILQCMEKCPDQLSAKLVFESGGSTMTLHAFGAILHRMARVDTAAEVTEETLLNSGMINTIFYNEKNIITAIDNLWN